ncbi:MAG: serine hydrolase, partial [Oscillospiraceae bacterium]|nr:serine hydrolase [Oscillospiraceae bacterium]
AVEPGSQYTYSNFGAGLTGAIVESVTGKDVSTYMRETLFAPLDIDAAYSATQLANPDDIAATYKKDGSTGYYVHVGRLGLAGQAGRQVTYNFGGNYYAESSLEY